MITINTGEGAVALEEFMNPVDDERFWISWTDKLAGETISTSEWIVPEGFEVVAGSELVSQSVTVDGVVFENANSAVIRTALEAGDHVISNKITTSGSRELSRSFTITLKET